MVAEPWDWYLDADPALHDRAWLDFLSAPAEPSFSELFDAARPRWHAQAACRGSEVDFFDPGAVDAAQALCEACPARDPCASAGRREPLGVWGGRARGFPGSAGCVVCGREGVRILGGGRCGTCYHRERR